jgi:hypothetical protein
VLGVCETLSDQALCLGRNCRRRLVIAVVVTLLLVVMMADIAMAEVHFCRLYKWDAYYQGYWMYNACGGGWSWAGEIPFFDQYPYRPDGLQLFCVEVVSKRQNV